MDLAGFGQGAFYKDKGRRIRDENGKDVGRDVDVDPRTTVVVIH